MLPDKAFVTGVCPYTILEHNSSSSKTAAFFDWVSCTFSNLTKATLKFFFRRLSQVFDRKKIPQIIYRQYQKSISISST